MNALNRLAMLLVALLLIAVPVLLLLVAFGVIPPDLANEYAGYRGAAKALGGLPSSSLATTAARITVGVSGAVLALLALLLLLRELTFGRRVARNVILEDEPGKETTIKSGAAKMLAECAAREAGAASPSVSLATKKGSYKVFCDVKVRGEANTTGLATGIRHNVFGAFERHGVPVRAVEVTVRGTEP
ncbi:MAG: hypothetical protein H0V21_05480 [Rubrobacter sp.]|nr:hypothetical protein [Rubrobacter sp.]